MSNPCHPYRFRLSSRGLLLAAISAAFAHSAFANSGRVDFTAGKVTVTGIDGSARQLVKGNEVKTGDRIISDADGRAQIRFSDGSFVSLQPNTDFDIKNYTYDGKTEGTEKAFFSLLKGAMRTVTGLVGRKNRNAYQLSTPTATIGIRGTGGVISVGSDGSTLVLGTSGVWTLTNPGGSLEVPAGTAGAVGTNPNQAPQQSSQGPTLPPTQSGGTQQQPPLSENRKSDGSSEGIIITVVKPPEFKPLVTGTNYAIAYAGAEGGSLHLGVPRNATFNSSGMMTSFASSSTYGTYTYTLGGTHAEFATADGVLAWGRWTGQVNNTNGSSSFNFSNPNTGVHYVVGIPTPAASLPTGVTYTYNMLGATSPTAVNGSVAPGTLTSATLTGNFSSNQVGVNFIGSINGKSFNATLNGMTLNTSTASFSDIGNNTSFTTGANTLNNTCTSLSVNGFFSGTGATHAGFAYLISNTQLVGAPNGTGVVGAVALKR